MAVARLLLLLAVSALTACGDSAAEAAMHAQLNAMNEFAAVLASIDDAESLEEARPRIRELGDEIAAMKAKWDAANSEGSDLSVEDFQAITEQTIEAQARVTTELQRITMDPALRSGAAGLMSDFGKAFGN